MCFNKDNPDYCQKHTRTKMKNGVCHICVMKGWVCDVDYSQIRGGFCFQHDAIPSEHSKVTDIFIADGEKIIPISEFKTSFDGSEQLVKNFFDKIKRKTRTIIFKFPITDEFACIGFELNLQKEQTKN